MGKNIKSYATNPTLSLGKGGKPHGKKSQSLDWSGPRLNSTYFGIPVFKIANKISLFGSPSWQNSSKPCKFCSIRHNPHESHRFRYKIHSHWLHAFRFLTIGRELHTIGANHADFTKFAHGSHEPREIRWICTHGQQSRSEPVNSRIIQRMTQILHHLHQQRANHAKLATFAHQTGKLRTFTHLCTLL